MFNGSRVFAHSLVIESKRGTESPAFGDFGDLLQNNPFLIMFQLKFCLKNETFLLLYISVLNCSILAIILFEYLLLDPSAGREADCPWDMQAPCPLFSAPMGPLRA